VAELGRRRPLLPGAALVALFVVWNLLLARQYRGGGWDYAGPVPFEDMGRGAVSLVDRALGSPFALPASLWEWLGGGPRPADYESLYMERRYARWSIRMGVDDRIFLEDGWSEPRELDGVACRLIARGAAGLVVPLHEARAYRFGARLRSAGPDAARLRVLLNDRIAGSWDAGTAWSDYELAVPADALRAGRNFVRLKAVGESARDAAFAVAGAWLEPDASSPRPP
jgi:hypothetical protein